MAMRNACGRESGGLHCGRRSVRGVADRDQRWGGTIKRASSNGIAGGIAAGAAIGGIGPSLLRSVGAYGPAADLEWFMSVYHHPDINWSALYAWAFLLSIGYLAATNCGVAVDYYRQRRRSRFYHWNMSAADAVVEIAFKSHLCNGASSEDSILKALDVFEQLAKDGQLKTAGRRPGTTRLEPISRRMWRDVRLARKSLGNGGEGRLVRRDAGKDQVVYEGVMIDSRQIDVLWPKGRGTGIRGAL